MMSSHSARVTSAASLRRLVPALLTSRSSRPNADATSAMARSMLACDPRSSTRRQAHAERFELCHRALEVLGAGRRHRHVEAVARERQRRRRADPVGGARDECGFLFVRSIHVASSAGVASAINHPADCDT